MLCVGIWLDSVANKLELDSAEVDGVVRLDITGVADTFDEIKIFDGVERFGIVETFADVRRVDAVERLVKAETLDVIIRLVAGITFDADIKIGAEVVFNIDSTEDNCVEVEESSALTP